MGLRWEVRLNREVAGLRPHWGVKTLPRALGPLFGAAMRLGVEPLTSFVSSPNYARWFKTAEGLKTVRALLQELERNPAVVTDLEHPSDSEDPEQIKSNLLSMEQYLSAGEAAGAEFYIWADS